MQANTFTPAQQEVLNVLSCLRSDEDLTELKKALVKFLDDRMQHEIEALWENGTLTEAKMEAYKHEHLRTAYR